MGEFWHTTGDGVRLWGRFSGPETGAVTVVLTHGYAQAHQCWHAQAEALAAAGFRVLVWDLRGHGESANPDLLGCTIERVADDLAELMMVHTTGPLVLVGHSMGGMALMALAERHPRLVADRVGAVAFVATSANGDGLGFLGLGLRGAHLVQAGGAWVFGRLARHRNSWRLVSGLGPVLSAGLWVSCCGWRTSRTDVRLTGEMAGQAGFATMAAFLPSLSTHHREPALAVYHGVPSLVLNGSLDLVVPPKDSEAIAHRLPGCRRVVVPRAGHNVMMAAPRRVRDELLALARRV
ncbi:MULTISPECIES: alpha/beta fold hydrolase [unclassified Luteococcus]|uniref:alpha/beta fold hydrolase n=1 Tax=unclassified Luteococcus TaxID=2639923 RepID=UPI00313C28EB